MEASTQMPLWPINRRGRSIQEMYEAWRETAHGLEVYRLFRRFAYRALESGVGHYSHKWIVERVRWEVRIETQSLDSFKVNNNYASRLARELIEEDGRFAELFNLRKLRSP